MCVCGGGADDDVGGAEVREHAEADFEDSGEGRFDVERGSTQLSPLIL